MHRPVPDDDETDGDVAQHAGHEHDDVDHGDGQQNGQGDLEIKRRISNVLTSWVCSLAVELDIQREKKLKKMKIENLLLRFGFFKEEI